MACKIDIRKAFDTMRWDFLDWVLIKFGFPQKFMGWISTILHSARLSVVINGKTRGYFACSRGVRQGDPLSPLLFDICEDILSRMFIDLVEKGEFLPMKMTMHKVFPSHLLYADDILLFCQASIMNAKSIQNTLRKYGEVSGQLCNVDKSHVYFGRGVTTVAKRRITRTLGFIHGSIPFDYLGVPLFYGQPKQHFFVSLKDRILSKFPTWMGKHLSMAGRICLVKSVIQASTVHAMLVYKWPKSILKIIDNACRNFIWTGGTSSRAGCTVSWDKLCAIREEGGLGLRSLALSNTCLLMKMAWKVVGSNDFGFDMLRDRYMTSYLRPKGLGSPRRFGRVWPLWLVRWWRSLSVC